MSNFPQCMMCKFQMGRRCTCKGETIPDEIYKNEVKCTSFRSISESDDDINDACCSENIRYEESLKSHED